MVSVLRPSHEYTAMHINEISGLTGVVISAAKSSRRSAASFARRRATRARARGVVRSCWTGSRLHVGVGVDAQLVRKFDSRVGFGVARSDDGDDIIMEDIASAEGLGSKHARVVSMSNDISSAKTSVDDGNDGGDDDNVI